MDVPFDGEPATSQMNKKPKDSNSKSKAYSSYRPSDYPNGTDESTNPACSFRKEGLAGVFFKVPLHGPAHELAVQGKGSVKFLADPLQIAPVPPADMSLGAAILFTTEA